MGSISAYISKKKSLNTDDFFRSKLLNRHSKEWNGRSELWNVRSVLSNEDLIVIITLPVRLLDRDRSGRRRKVPGFESPAGSVRSRWETYLRIAGTPGKNGCDP